MTLPNPPAEIYVPVRVDLTCLSEDDKAAFVRGWENAGGYTDDRDCPCPPDAIWCMPWTFHNHLDVPAGMTMTELGAWWWDECHTEVDELLMQQEGNW